MRKPFCNPPTFTLRDAPMFALPVILVAAGETRLPCQIEVETITQQMREHGLLAPDATVSLSPALIDIDTLNELASSRRPGEAAASAPAGDDPFGLSPVPIAIKEESAWLRFMVGSVRPQTAILETHNAVGKWAMPLSQTLSKMLARDGATLLALPRAPQDLEAAQKTGRATLLETRLQLFASNTIRAIRSKHRTPVVVIAPHEGNEIRITLSSGEDSERWYGFVWPLESNETRDAVTRFATGLFQDCRISDIRVIDAIQPDLADGLPFFITAHIPPRRTL